jgi:zinc-binding alcohol dehydrogenase/oxidoreductase
VRALVLREVETPLRLEERPVPEVKPHEALIRLRAAALNRRDFWIQQGLYRGVETPVVLGSDGAGLVERVGEEVDAALVGREVVINPGLNWGKDPRAQSSAFEILGLPRDGTLAEFVVVAASQVHPKPSHLGWEEAAALPLAGLTAYRALFTQAGLDSGERVLVTGIGGGVATIALLFSVAAGAEVWVTSSSTAKIEKAKSLGARGGVLYTDPDWVEVLREEGGAPDLTVDSAGGEDFARLVEAAAAGGRIVNYGATGGNIKELNVRQLFWKQLRLIGSTMGTSREFASMLEFVSRHRIRPVVDRVLPLEEGNRAFECLGKSSQFGKLVVRITDAQPPVGGEP